MSSGVKAAGVSEGLSGEPELAGHPQMQMYSGKVVVMGAMWNSDSLFHPTMIPAEKAVKRTLFHDLSLRKG